MSTDITPSNSLQLLVNELFNDLGLSLPPAKSQGEQMAEAMATANMRKAEPAHTVNFTKQLSYFGKSIAVGDFDGDGIKEAFVGAPGYSLVGQG